MIGQTIAHYHVLEKLGEGGMGVVYKARDTHLDRFVAVKVLPPEKLADPERKRRFVQEAKAASALNHPNIITIHDISHADGVDFIVMEYVAGKTLAELVGRKGLKLNETLKCAIQIAEALARAHSVGIVHRDLKPANVMVDEHGLVKVLDFGLAKLTEAAADEEAPTQTAEGAIVGTAAYMSPEQAGGRKVDARSDIFSFGSMLYEMLTGRRAFQGDSKLSTLAAIIHKEPDPLPADLPRDLAKLVARCLRKDPERRFQYMKDLKVELEELKEESDSGALAGAAAAPRKRRRSLSWAAAASGLAVLAVLAWLLAPDRRPPEPAMTAVPLTSYAGQEYDPGFSPDGNQVAFSWNGEKQDNFDIYVQLIGSGRPLRLTSDPAPDFAPAFSPDGRHIAFLRDLSPDRWGVFLIPPLGGPERKVAEVSASVANSGVAWSRDSRWLVTSDRDSPANPLALFLLSVETGEKRKLTSPSGLGYAGDHQAAFSPDGLTVVFIRFTDRGVGDMYLLALGEDLTPRGEPERLTSDNRFFSRAAWTPDGREIIFSSGNTVQTWGLWRIQAAGQAKPQRLDFAGEGVSQPAVSPAGRRMAYARVLQDLDIWAVETTGVTAGQPKNFISSTRIDFNPQFSPDGKRVVFASSRSGSAEIWVCEADGSNAVPLTAFGGPDTGTPRWSPDGEYIVFDSLAAGNRDLHVVSAGGGKPRALTREPSQDRVPSWSRDGHWIYFTSNRGGDDQVWKMPWAPSGHGGEAVQVTRNGGYVAFESPDGKTLYYTKSPAPGPLFRLPLEGGAESQVLASVYQRAFTVTGRGIYFIAAPDARGIALLQFLDLATGKTRPIAALERPLYLGLTVPPDGRTVLYSQYALVGSDLMLVENFR